MFATRRQMLAGSIGLLGGATLLSACGSRSAGGGTARVSLWGTDDRAQRVSEAIELFMADKEEGGLQTDSIDWGSYWDRLSTNVAGGSIPDLMMQEDRYIGEYARRGILADLGGLELGDSDKTLLERGVIDGVLRGVPTGSNVTGIIANPALFEAAGVDIPDDSSWTWEEYEEIANQITQGSPDGVYGTTDYSYNEVVLSVYARQHGFELFDADGRVGVEAELVAEYFARSIRLQESAGQPPADFGLNLDLLDSPLATGAAAMSATWAAQMGTLAEATGEDLVILRLPGETESERRGMFLKPAMYWSRAEESPNAEIADAFIEFFVTSPEVGDIFLTELGIPLSPTVREAVAENLPEADARAAEFIEDISGELEEGPPVLPEGAGAAADLVNRINQEVLFGNLTPVEAGKQLVADLESELG